MSSDRWRQISVLYHDALAKNAEDRGAYLYAACAGDDTLRQEVEALLAHDSREAIVDTPAWAAAAQAMAANPAGSLVGRGFGVYQLISLLGAGAMGEVYRARDTKLGRDVAIKILPRLFSSDPERLGRFRREARVLAALNHPSIGAIYGLEDIDGMPALVLELVEGETLSERLARATGSAGRGLPVAEAVTLARHIAGALETAHEKGIIHRDLKPANIKIRPDGTIKVLDFGLAKAAVHGGSQDIVQLQSTISRATHEGIILGTPAYMSPEQAQGRAVDKRTDIWAFGCVLYEMLSGRRVFHGETLADTLASALTREPDWTALPPDTPSTIRTLLRRCLAKDRAHRLADIGDARLELDDAQATSPAVTRSDVADRPRNRWSEALGWSVAAACLLLAIGGFFYNSRTHQTAGVVRFAIPAVRSLDTGSTFALSPNGQSVAFVAPGASGDQVIWIRKLDKLDATPLNGTEGAHSPFWSPDNQSIAFFAQGKLKRIPSSGGAAQTLSQVPSPAFDTAGSWSPEGSIIFAQTFGPLQRVSAEGGESTPITVVNGSRGEFGHYNPQFFADGNHFAFEIGASPQRWGIHVGSLTSRETIRLFPRSVLPFVVTPDGFFLFVEQSLLKAQKLDLRRRQLVGEAVTLADGVVGASVAANGTLAYEPVGGAQTQPTWFDRSGKRLGTVGSPGSFAGLALSPDESRVAVARDGDIWVLDLSRGNETRLTSDPLPESAPVWSPDGQQVLYERGGDLFRKSSSGGGAEELVLKGRNVVAPQEWSSDGRFVTYFGTGRGGLTDLFLLNMKGGESRVVPFLETKFQEAANRLSPGGTLMAYSSDESGRYEVYVQTFPITEQKWLVSRAGGLGPHWRRDGRELFYFSPEGTLMAVDVTTVPGFALGVPRALFQTKLRFGAGYDVSGDGQRFLINSLVGGGTSAIVVVLNWQATERAKGNEKVRVSTQRVNTTSSVSLRRLDRIAARRSSP